MATESTTGGTPEPPRKGSTPQQAQGGEPRARTPGAPPRQQEAGREPSRGLPRRGQREPGEIGMARPVLANPFSLIRRMIDDLDSMFEEFGLVGVGGRELERRGGRREGTWMPSLDVLERDGKLVVRADLPGLGKDAVRVEVADDQLVIEGERREEREVERAGMYRSERAYGTFRREIPLPEGVDPDSAEAHFDSGVLEVSFRISEQKRRGRRIEITEGKSRLH